MTQRDERQSYETVHITTIPVSKSPARLALACDCIGSCQVALITEWDKWSGDPREWSIDFYEQVGTPHRLRERLRLLWQIARGKDPWRHGLVIHEPQIAQLREFLRVAGLEAAVATATNATTITVRP